MGPASSLCVVQHLERHASDAVGVVVLNDEDVRVSPQDLAKIAAPGVAERSSGRALSAGLHVAVCLDFQNMQSGRIWKSQI